MFPVSFRFFPFLSVSFRFFPFLPVSSRFFPFLPVSSRGVKKLNRRFGSTKNELSWVCLPNISAEIASQSQVIAG